MIAIHVWSYLNILGQTCLSLKHRHSIACSLHIFLPVSSLFAYLVAASQALDAQDVVTATEILQNCR